jgi:hypothetical protein
MRMCISHSSVGSPDGGVKLLIVITDTEHTKGLCCCEQRFSGIEAKPHFVYFANRDQLV